MSDGPVQVNAKIFNNEVVDALVKKGLELLNFPEEKYLSSKVDPCPKNLGSEFYDEVSDLGKKCKPSCLADKNFVPKGEIYLGELSLKIDEAMKDLKVSGAFIPKDVRALDQETQKALRDLNLKLEAFRKIDSHEDKVSAMEILLARGEKVLDKFIKAAEQVRSHNLAQQMDAAAASFDTQREENGFRIPEGKPAESFDFGVGHGEPGVGSVP